MYDFFLTFPYGVILIIGGVIGYAKKRSVASLCGGVGAGLLLIVAGILSYMAFEKSENSYFALILETIDAAGLTYVMGQRYMETSKIMPAGVIAGISAAMTIFYIYKVSSGGNHFLPRVGNDFFPKVE